MFASLLTSSFSCYDPQRNSVKLNYIQFKAAITNGLSGVTGRGSSVEREEGHVVRMGVEDSNKRVQRLY